MPNALGTSALVGVAFGVIAGCDYMAYDVLQSRGDPTVDPAACAEGFAECDGSTVTKCESNLKQNPKHCGWCGHECGSGNACRAGLCDPFDVGVSEGDPAGLHLPGGPYSKWLFWSVKKGTEIRAVQVSGGAPVTLARTGATPATLGRVRMAVGWNWLYWVNTADGVLWRSGAIGTNQVAEQIVASGVIDVASYGGISYLTTGGELHSGDPIQNTFRLTATIPGATGFASPGNGLAWIVTPGGVVQPGSDVATAWAPPGTLLGASATVGSAADGEGRVYFVTAPGTISFAPATPWPPLAAVNVASGMTNARQLTTAISNDDTRAVTSVYWLAGGTLDGPGQIYARDARLAGGTPTVLTEVQASELTTGTDRLFFLDTTTGVVMAIAR